MRLITDIFALLRSAKCRNWNTITISGYHIREAGSHRRAGSGLHAGQRHRLCGGGARGRAGRGRLRAAAFVLLQRPQQLPGRGRQVPRRAAAVGAGSCASASARKNPHSWQLRFHTQTGGVTLTAQQPENNVVRVTLQALAAVLGGTQIAAHQQHGRGAGAAHRESRAGRAAHPADHRLRDRRGRHGRSAGRVLPDRAA